MRMRDSERTRLACRHAAAGGPGQGGRLLAETHRHSHWPRRKEAGVVHTTVSWTDRNMWVSVTFPPGPPPWGALQEALHLRGPAGSWTRRRALGHVGGFHSTTEAAAFDGGWARSLRKDSGSLVLRPPNL